MTPVTRWFLKASLVWLIAASVSLVLTAMAMQGSSGVMEMIIWHMLALGWIGQVIIGVSIWMFPRRADGRRERENLKTWSLFVFYNAGLLLRVSGEYSLADPDVFLPGELFVSLAAGMHLIAAGLYVIEIWPRVRGKTDRSKKRSE